jgi:regulatory protein
MGRALRLLTGRDRTVAELRRRLTDSGFEETTVEEVLARLGALGYLDDSRVARIWAESALPSGPWFGLRLRNELLRRGVPRDIADDISREQDEESTEKSARMLLLRRYPAYAPSAATPAERQRVYQFLLRRGISPAAAISALSATESDNGF